LAKNHRTRPHWVLDGRENTYAMAVRSRATACLASRVWQAGAMAAEAIRAPRSGHVRDARTATPYASAGEAVTIAEEQKADAPPDTGVTDGGHVHAG
jgi:hypothetical protein